ncbi:hypothetical protein BHM03_00011734 [Ensete ventricosum]|nr:hypothetical protein BHM03_00011734 [Ensete ventricosum]
MLKVSQGHKWRNSSVAQSLCGSMASAEKRSYDREDANVEDFNTAVDEATEDRSGELSWCENQNRAALLCQQQEPLLRLTLQNRQQEDPTGGERKQGQNKRSGSAVVGKLHKWERRLLFTEKTMSMTRPKRRKGGGRMQQNASNLALYLLLVLQLRSATIGGKALKAPVTVAERDGVAEAGYRPSDPERRWNTEEVAIRVGTATGKIRCWRSLRWRCGVVDRENRDGLTVVDLGGDVNLATKERTKSTNGWQHSSAGGTSLTVQEEEGETGDGRRKEQPATGRREEEGAGASGSLRRF